MIPRTWNLSHTAFYCFCLFSSTENRSPVPSSSAAGSAEVVNRFTGHLDVYICIIGTNSFHFPDNPMRLVLETGPQKVAPTWLVVGAGLPVQVCDVKAQPLSLFPYKAIEGRSGHKPFPGTVAELCTKPADSADGILVVRLWGFPQTHGVRPCRQSTLSTILHVAQKQMVLTNFPYCSERVEVSCNSMT